MYQAFGNLDAAYREAEYALRKVPYFRKALSSAALRPFGGTSSSEHWSHVPTTSKADYRRHFPSGVLAEGHSVNDPYVMRMQSSGTSGERLVSVVHAFKLAERMATCVSINRDLAFLVDEPTIRTCRYAAPNCSDVECSNPRTTMAERTLPDGTLVLPVHHDLLTTPEEMLRLAFEELHTYAPNVWYMDPMHMVFLINTARAKGWHFAVPRRIAVLLSFTMVTVALQRQIDNFLSGRYPVAGALAMSEFGLVGMDCHLHTLHLDDRDYYLELESITSDADEFGLAELIITSVGDRLSPHIRYRTNDVYRILPKCECQNPMPAVSFEGRRKDMVTLKSGKMITPKSLEQAVGSPEWLDMYQLTYQRPNHFTLRYRSETLGDHTELTALRERIAQLVDSPHVQLEPVEYFPFERGGKFQLIRHA